MVAEGAPLSSGSGMADRRASPGLVVVRPVGGLCNRLRVISSFQVLARYTGRELRLCWAPSNGFSDEDLGELFENEFARIDEAEFDRLCEEDALCLHEVISISGVLGRRTWRWDPGIGMDQVLDAAARPVVAYRGLQRLDGLVGHAAAAELPRSFADDYLTELRSWRPVEPIQRAVDEVAAGFDSGTVGIHVRRGDALTHPNISNQFRLSSDRAFFARMDELLRDDPGTTFFLATDSADTDARFRERYGGALRTNRAKRFVPSVIFGPKENQRDAVVDLFALARTRHLLGTRYSSFSRAAADLGGISREVLIAGAWPNRMRWKLVQILQNARYHGRPILRRLAARRQIDG